MGRINFQKFEMKYGYYLPDEYKNFILKYGGETQFGSCSFEYPENVINNLIRIPAQMDFHLIPFGDIGNGDYYCFYKYGIDKDSYYVGIWLHETKNFVILASSFSSFIFKCILDEYLSIVLSDDEEGYIDNDFKDDTIKKCEKACIEFNLNMDKVRLMKNEFDYHRIMVENDNNAIQSLCYIGDNLIKKNDPSGLEFLNRAMKSCSFYTAPYYITGKMLYNLEKDSSTHFLKALKTSLITTGYSYWQEDFIQIPEDVHREISLFADQYLKDCEDYFNKSIYNGKDPYDYEFRFEMAKRYVLDKNYNMAMIEYNNSIFMCDDNSALKDILKSAYKDAKEAGFYYLTGIIENDTRKLR